MTSSAFDPAIDDLIIAKPRKEIVFIESDVADIGTLISGIGRDKEVVILDSSRDGLHQIAQALAGKSGIDAVHIMSHGEAGAVHLGSLILDSANLDAYKDDLQAIRQGMSADGDILLYGCKVGAGDSGASFVQQLAIATGADVAASSDTTGAAALGGDWDLEVVSGQVGTASAVDARTAALYQDVLNISPGTITFSTPGNFVSGLNPADNAARLSAGTDVVYRVNGNAAYELQIDGASHGVFSYTSSGQGNIFSGLPSAETALTISFLGGQLFTTGAIAIANYNNYTFADETFVIKGYDASGHQVGSTISKTLAYASTATSIDLTGLGGTALQTLKITAADGALDYFLIDSISVSSVMPAPPHVTFVTSSHANGTFKAGETIDIQVNFDNAVDVTGTPQLTLETGTTDRTINYVSGTGTSELTFRYIVQAGDTAADLDYKNASIALNGGTIKAYLSTQDAVVVLPAPGAGGSLASNRNIVIDTTAPTLAITSDKSVLKAGEAAAITFTFSEDPGASFTWNGSSGDVTVSGGTLSAITGSGTTRTATFTPTPNLDSGTASISVSAGAYADAVGNINAATSNGPAITYDTKAPTVTVASDHSALKAGETATITFTFSEDPGASFIASDLTFSGGSLGSISGSGTTRTAIFTPTANIDNGTATVTVKNASFQDAAGNSNSTGGSTSLTYDTKAPTLAVTSDKPSLTVGETATITFTFSEDPGASFSWDGSTGSIVVSGGTLSALTGSGTTRTATFTPDAGTNNGTAAISVTGANYEDAAGNTGANASLSFAFDTQAPANPSAPVLAAADDKGDSSTDGITNKGTLQFSGTADAGATVKLYDTNGVTQIGSGIADGGGNWSIVTSTLASGSHTIKAMAFDAAGNASSLVTGPAIFIDTAAPTLSITSSAPTLKAGDTATITFTFSEDPGSSFSWDGGAGSITVSGGVLSAIQGSGTTRTATFTPNANTDAGSAHIAVASGAYHDLAGNDGTASNNLALSYDTLRPSVPSAPDLATGDDSGASSSDGVTNDDPLSFSGSADTGATVKLFDGATEIGSVTASGGAYTIAVASLAEGDHTLTAIAYDAAGNASVASSVSTVVVDRTPPSTAVAGAALSADTGASATDMVTKEAQQTISGTLGASLAIGEQVMVSLDNGATWNPATASVGANTWELAGVTLAGSGTLKVQVVDLAGNGGPVYAHAYTLDQVAPPATSMPDLDAGSDSGVSNTDNITGVTLPSFSGTAEVGARVVLFDGGIEIGSDVAVDGTWHITTSSATPLNQRIHYITTDVIDLAGNHGPTSPVLELDVRTAGPVTTVASMVLSSDSGTAGDFVTNTASQTVSGTLSANLTDGERVQVSRDGGTSWNNATSATGSNAWSIAATLLSGTHDIMVRVIDPVDNTGPVHTQAYTLDTVRPLVAITSDVAQLKAGETANITFTFTEDPGSSFDGTDITVSGGTLSAMSGSGSTRTAVFTPDAGTNGGTASISIDAGKYQDIAGNDGVAGASPSISFDTLAPGAASTPDLDQDSDKGSSSTDKLTNATSLVFKGTAEAGATVKLYDSNGSTEIGSGTATGGNWTITTSTLGAGSHTVTAKVIDAAGNLSAASSATTVTIDTAKPTLAITSDVSQLKAGGTATITFTFSEDPGASFDGSDVALSGGTLSAISGTGLVRTATFTPAANTNGGTASISVGGGAYQDAAGNDGAAGATPSLHFDTLAPAAPPAPVLAAGSDTGSSSSDRITSDTTPVFTGTKEAGATVTLYDSDGSVLGTDSTPGGAWSIESSTLGEGTHTITVKQTDSAGNAGAVSAAVTVVVDTHAAAPAAPVLAASSDSAAAGDGLTSDTTPTITGSAEAGASVTLYDSDGSTVLGTATADAGGAWSITSSALTAGTHELTVRQVDVAGNSSAASIALTLNIDNEALALAAPTLTLASDSGTPGDAITKATTPTFSGSAEALAQVTLYDGATAIGSVQAGADGAWQITSATLLDGVHAISARQVDRAGNESGAGTVFSFTVDTVAPAAPAAPLLKASSDTGSIGDGVTENAIPVIEGTALADTLVTLYETVGGSKIKLGTAMADGSGNWSVATSGLSTGIHLLSATQTDAAGNESAASAGFTLRIAEPPVPIDLVDGMPVTVYPISLPGNVPGTAVSIPVVSAGRAESSGQAGVADIPLVTTAQGGTLLLAQLAPGYGLSASGANLPAANAGELLIAAIKAATPSHAPSDQGHLTGNGQAFLTGLGSSGSLLVETVKPVSSAAPEGVLTLSGPAPAAGQSTALVIDAGGLAAGATISLQQVNFAAVIGAANVTAGSGMILTGDAASQHFTVAAGGAGSVFAGGGSDTLSVAAPAAAGPAPAAGAALLHGGAANDAATFSGARADYNIEFHNGYVMVSTKAAPDVKAMVVNVEQLQFSDASITVQNNADMGTLAGIYQTVLGRQADVMGIEYWANVHQAGASWGAIALSMIASNEHAASHGGFNGVAAHDLALLYTAIFDREADAGGMAYWTAALGRGLTLEQVASSFVESAEMVGHQRAATDWDFFVG
jgi:hypothetical protein